MKITKSNLERLVTESVERQLKEIREFNKEITSFLSERAHVGGMAGRYLFYLYNLDCPKRGATGEQANDETNKYIPGGHDLVGTLDNIDEVTAFMMDYAKTMQKKHGGKAEHYVYDHWFAIDKESGKIYGPRKNTIGGDEKGEIGLAVQCKNKGTEATDTQKEKTNKEKTNKEKTNKEKTNVARPVRPVTVA